MATKMNTPEIKSFAKNQIMEKLGNALSEIGATVVGASAFAPVKIDENLTVFVEMNFKTKQWTDTKTADAFDLEQFKEDFAFEEELRQKKAAETAAAKEKAKKERETAKNSRKRKTEDGE